MQRRPEAPLVFFATLRVTSEIDLSCLLEHASEIVLNGSAVCPFLLSSEPPSQNVKGTW